MGKKKLIDLVTISVEDKLDSNGALRNVAVKDAWQRLRQNIDVVTSYIIYLYGVHVN
jgi:hypothetical protein